MLHIQALSIILLNIVPKGKNMIQWYIVYHPRNISYIYWKYVKTNYKSVTHIFLRDCRLFVYIYKLGCNTFNYYSPFLLQLLLHNGILKKQLCNYHILRRACRDNVTSIIVDEFPYEYCKYYTTIVNFQYKKCPTNLSLLIYPD